MVKLDREYLSEEEKRLADDRNRKKYWKKWGSYLAERQWATGELIQLGMQNSNFISARGLFVSYTVKRTSGIC
jgi:hypothetical protein